MISLVWLVVLLWLPGALLHRGLGVAAGPWGSGRLAVEAVLSLAFLTLLFLPVYLAGASVWAAPWVFFLAVVVLVFGVSVFRKRRELRGLVKGTGTSETSPLERTLFVVGAALLVVPALLYSGANVDDWWDLSFVSGWIAQGHFSFGQMALMAEPGEGTLPHPRFLWSVWLMLQTVVGLLGGKPLWEIQAGPLAAVTMVLVLSAQAALARSLFSKNRRVDSFVCVTLAMTVAWVWGTEAIPLFVRGYQDKLVAAFVVAPVLLAFVLRAATAGRGSALAVAAAALACVSVHSLIFTMSAFVCVLTLAAIHGRELLIWSREHKAVIAGLCLPALYPLGQALALAVKFGDQGISLATRGNPVVRAHLSLNRLIADATSAWIVDPVAVFGSVALVAVLALVAVWKDRRSPLARVLLVTTLVPCAILFVPGLAGIAGKLWVPWMLYRLGWMIPVAPLLAYAALAPIGLSDSPDLARPSTAHRVFSISLAALVFLLACSSGGDRLRRDMGAHPGQPYGAPQAGAAAVYAYLAAQPGREAVMALPSFAERIPALSGKPVVAFPERGTLVFSTRESRAYERMRERAEFFSAATSMERRNEIAAKYGVRWAVLPRRLVSVATEQPWLRRFSVKGLLAALAADEAAASTELPCGPNVCPTWWSASSEGVRARLGDSWNLVLENRDYFVVEQLTRDAVAKATHDPATGGASENPSPWLQPFTLSAPESSPRNSQMLASIVGAPGALVSYSLPPRFVAATVVPVWVEGPMAWEDAPAEVEVSLDMESRCRVEAVEVIAHLPHDRREVLEVRVGDSVARLSAHDGESVFLGLDGQQARQSVSVLVRSLLGNPVSLTDVRLLGDPASCDPSWPVHRNPRSPGLATSSAAELALLGGYPLGTPVLVSLWRRAAKTRGEEGTTALLSEAVRRDPSLVEGWIELGFVHDELSETETARRSFAAAVTADSSSAWALGCLAWSEQRSGHTFAAAWHSAKAAYMDPQYADAWTVLAHVLADLRLASLAERSLRRAERIDPTRNWPTLARADLALARGDVEGAREALRPWLRRFPFDESVRSKLSDVAALTATTNDPVSNTGAAGRVVSGDASEDREPNGADERSGSDAQSATP